MPTSKPPRYALHLWDALNEARIIYSYCRFDPAAQEQWRGLIAFDAEQMDEYIENQIESTIHKRSVVAHLEKRSVCLKEFDRLVSKENSNGHHQSKARR